jgi:hypothetical protein
MCATIGDAMTTAPVRNRHRGTSCPTVSLVIFVSLGLKKGRSKVPPYIGHSAASATVAVAVGVGTRVAVGVEDGVKVAVAARVAVGAGDGVDDELPHPQTAVRPSAAMSHVAACLHTGLMNPRIAHVLPRRGLAPDRGVQQNLNGREHTTSRPAATREIFRAARPQRPAPCILDPAGAI